MKKKAKKTTAQEIASLRGTIGNLAAHIYEVEREIKSVQFRMHKMRQEIKTVPSAEKAEAFLDVARQAAWAVENAAARLGHPVTGVRRNPWWKIW